MKYKWTVLTIVLAFCLPAVLWAKDPINTNWRGLAVKGYDTVAYFTEGKPIKGKKDFEFQWQGARWRFANAGIWICLRPTRKNMHPSMVVTERGPLQWGLLQILIR